MIDPRAELIKRVTNAITELRQELINAGVPEADVWQRMMVDEPPGVVTIVCAFDTPVPVKTVKVSQATIEMKGDSEEDRQAAADALVEALVEHRKKKA